MQTAHPPAYSPDYSPVCLLPNSHVRACILGLGLLGPHTLPLTHPLTPPLTRQPALPPNSPVWSRRVGTEILEFHTRPLTLLFTPPSALPLNLLVRAWNLGLGILGPHTLPLTHPLTPRLLPRLPARPPSFKNSPIRHWSPAGTRAVTEHPRALARPPTPRALADA